MFWVAKLCIMSVMIYNKNIKIQLVFLKVFMSCPIYIISLKRTPERKCHMQRQLDAYNLDYHFVEAIDKYHLHDKEYRMEVADELGIDESTMEHKYKTLKDRGFPVLLSHIKVYNEIIKAKSQVACVLEDDSYILPSFPEVLTAASENPCWDILKLGSYGRSPISIMNCLFKSYNPPELRCLMKALRAVGLIYIYGVMSDKIDDYLYKTNRHSSRERIFQSLGIYGKGFHSGLYEGIRLDTAYKAALKVFKCFFHVLGNYLYFNTTYGKILKKYANSRRICMDEPGSRFWLPRYYASEMGVLPNRNKASWHKLTSKYYMANPAEPTVSGTAYMLRLPATVKCKKVVTNIDVPLQHIDVLPYFLYRWGGIRLFICCPPCVKFTYGYLIHSARYQYLGGGNQ